MNEINEVPHTIRGLLQQAALSQPNAVALRHKQNGTWLEISYRELLHRTKTVSEILCKLEQKSGSRIALFFDNEYRWPEIYLPNYGWVPIDPQGGDKVRPRDRAMNIGHLSNRFLITTHCGGYSEYMGWYYNSYETYQLEPKTQVNIETIGEWEPILN